MTYTQEIGPLLLNLVWDKFLGQQKVTTFFAKVSQKLVSSPAANIVPLQNLLSWASTVHITLLQGWPIKLCLECLQPLI